MSFAKWVLAGGIGGLVGAAIWAAISYGINAEIGWIAWGIGGLVGLCVRVAAGEQDEGFGPGVTAAVIAIASVLLGKYIAISLLVNNLAFGAGMANVTPSDMIASFADDIVEERQAKGQAVTFPAGKSLETARVSIEYPPDVWKEAEAKWQAIPPDQQQQKIEQEKEAMQALMGMVQGIARREGFIASFGLFDALWFFLAAATAFRLGAGNTGSED